MPAYLPFLIGWLFTCVLALFLKWRDMEKRMDRLTNDALLLLKEQQRTADSLVEARSRQHELTNAVAARLDRVPGLIVLDEIRTSVRALEAEVEELQKLRDRFPELQPVRQPTRRITFPGNDGGGT